MLFMVLLINVLCRMFLRISMRYLDFAKFRRMLLVLLIIFGYFEIERRFLAAAAKQPEEGVADLQNAMGILYNLNHNYSKAVDCLSLAVQLKPTVSLLI